MGTAFTETYEPDLVHMSAERLGGLPRTTLHHPFGNVLVFVTGAQFHQLKKANGSDGETHA